MMMMMMMMMNSRTCNTYNLQKLHFFLLRVFTSFVYCSEYKLIAFLNDVKQWHTAMKAVSTFCGVYLNLYALCTTFHISKA
jgi:hypothetical protein